MREIKFRAWGYWRSKIIKRKGKEMSMQDKQEMFIPKKDEWLDAFFRRLRHSCVKWELMEFTGLKDKNGKEIYEGDIVKGQAYKDGEIQIKEVEFDEGQFYADIELSNRDFYEAIERDWVEVIGNKFENQELLK